MALLTIGEHKVDEDSYRFPSPDLIIQSVTRKEALKALGTQGVKQGHGLVYFYLDRGYQENNVIYIGETGNSIQSRHNATHSKAKWFASLRYPLIGVVQSPYRKWDTDTRRVIEAQVVYELRQRGFSPFNHENSTWKDGVDFSSYDDKAYLESVVEKIVEYVLFHVGLESDEKVTPADQSKSSSSAQTTRLLVDIDNTEPDSHPEVSIQEDRRQGTTETTSKKQVRRNIASNSHLWEHPAEGRKLFYSNKKRGISAYGYQTKDGKVVLTRVEGLPAAAASYVSMATKELHSLLLKDATQSEDKTLCWIGETKPLSGSTSLSAVVGGSMSKMEWGEVAAKHAPTQVGIEDGTKDRASRHGGG